MMFSLGSGHSLTIPRHWNFMEFPEMNPTTKKVSPASPDVMTNSMMTEQQKKAVMKIVRRSLKGLCNEALSLSIQKMKLNIPPSLFLQIKWSQEERTEAWRR